MKNILSLLLVGLIALSFKGSTFLTLGNLVWNDANGNGIKEAFEAGIGGVTVKLYADSDGNNVPDGPGFGTVIATTTTTATGSYIFSNLAPGKYIASIVIPTGYTVSPTFSTNPDNNINNDNNSAVVFNSQTEIRSNAITLSLTDEPVNDGDDSDGNLTLDLAICGQGGLGDFVWCDRNANGLQEDDETGFANVSVTLIYPDGTTYQKFTDANGKYSFVNLGLGIHKLLFGTPTGFTASPALAGSDRGKDSDPVAGLVTINVLPAANDLNYDAGFYLKTCAITGDTDGDCIADIDDLDDDNDGIIDDVENSGYDAVKDCDGDGVINYRDATPGCPLRTGNNIYGNPFKPLVWMDCNNDSVNDFFDWDRDGIINELDFDSDNDGILDIRETLDSRIKDNNLDGMADGIDEDGDGIMSSADLNDKLYGGPGLRPNDLDRDGLPNYLDLDSDGDGIVDITEALLFTDSDGLANGLDSDKDGVSTVVYNNNDNSADNFNGFGAKGIKVLDTDNDGFLNPFDIDSDNDGITDNVEAQPTCGELQPYGVDADGDGLDDAYDVNLNACRHNAHGITPYDKDADGTPDMYDTDTDNDGAPDQNEGSGVAGDFITNYNDTDGDGLIDQFDIFNINLATVNLINNVAHSNMGPNGNFDGPLPGGSNPQLPQSKPGDCTTNVDRDWRDVSVLPVILVEFKGKLNTNEVMLTWTTANEVNMKQYVVERSTDGQVYTSVGAVNAKGNSTLRNSYVFNDDVRNVNAAVAYYRLKQVDNTSLARLSHVISFNLGKRSMFTFSISPNPAAGNFAIKLNAAKDGSATVSITDMLGRNMQMQNTKVISGVNTIQLNAGKLAKGMYTIRIIMDEGMLSQKIVISK